MNVFKETASAALIDASLGSRLPGPMGEQFQRKTV